MSIPGHFDLGHESPGAGPSQPSYIHPPNNRRPWSPINYDDQVGPRGRNDFFSRQGRNENGRRRKQEASGDSIEALDLADYATTLRRADAAHDSPYPPFPHTSHVHPFNVPTPRMPISPQPPFTSYPEYPPSPPPARPFSVASRDTFSQAPPSLVSGESSYETHESYGSIPGRPYPNRRPYSLPSFLAPMGTAEYPHSGPAIFSAQSSSPTLHSMVRLASPTFEDHHEYGDISQQYPGVNRARLYDDPYFQSKAKRFSAPGTHSNSSNRDINPWGSEPDGPRVDERWLEHEFGGKGRFEAGAGDDEPLIGSVDEKGALITAGPKKRKAARWMQAVFGLAAVGTSVYGALFIKSPTPAPPSGKPPAFALYALSFLSFLLTFYLFAIRPCCCGPRPKEGQIPGAPGMPGGMMVLPVQSLPGGKEAKKAKGKKGKKGKNGMMPGGDVQVNLIVDPGMFSGHDSSSDEEDEYNPYAPDGSVQNSSARTRRKAKRRKRRGIMEGIAMEAAWKAARSELRKMFMIDVGMCLLWVAVFVFVLFGKRCPSGGFNGWCNAYNLSTAISVFICLSFGFSIYFDIVDLHASRASPRTRT